MKKIFIVLVTAFLLFGCSAGPTEDQNSVVVEQNLTVEMIADYLINEKLETNEDWLLFLGIHGIGFDSTAEHIVYGSDIVELFKEFTDPEAYKEFYEHFDEAMSLINDFKSTTKTLCSLKNWDDDRVSFVINKILENNEDNIVFSSQILYYDYSTESEKYLLSTHTIPVIQIITLPKEYEIKEGEHFTEMVFDNCKIMKSLPKEYIKDPKLDESYELYYEGPISFKLYSSVQNLILIKEKPLDKEPVYRLISESGDEYYRILDEKKDWILEKNHDGYSKYIFTEKDTRAKENMEAIFKEGKGTWTIDFIQDIFGEDNLPFSPDGKGGFYEGEVTGEGYLTCDKFYDDYCTMHFRLGAVEGDFDFYYEDMPHALIENIKFKSSGPGGYAYVYGSLDMTYNE